MLWIKDFLTHQPTDVTIISKCGSPINYSPPNSNIITLHNYGRCDHSYALWMMRMNREDATENHLVLFLKASRSSKYHGGMKYRPLEDVLRIAMVNGFACGYENDSVYFHDTATLRTFAVADYKDQQIKSSYGPLCR